MAKVTSGRKFPWGIKTTVRPKPGEHVVVKPPLGVSYGTLGKTLAVVAGTCLAAGIGIGVFVSPPESHAPPQTTSTHESAETEFAGVSKDPGNYLPAYLPPKIDSIPEVQDADASVDSDRWKNYAIKSRSPENEWGLPYGEVVPEPEKPDLTEEELESFLSEYARIEREGIENKGFTWSDVKKKLVDRASKPLSDANMLWLSRENARIPAEGNP
ncbi:MAG: hypothetical protein ABH851_09540 [Methanobacteriota archaeon]